MKSNSSEFKQPCARSMPFGERRRGARSKNRFGAALVEFALVAPLMILFTMGLIDIGRMTMVKQLLINASREGARQASLPFATSASVQSDVLKMLSDSGIIGSVSHSPSSLTSATAGTTVTVTVTADANSVSWMGTSMFMFGKNITASTSMRRESL